MPQQIAIFASGQGSNAKHLIDYFAKSEIAKISLVVTNNKDAGVIEIANKNNIPILVLSKSELTNKDFLLDQLKHINYIILAGFLLLIPDFLVGAYSNKIINIHPALLPKYGGKGMYGKRVHEAVFENKEIETGITIHFVNEHFDEGEIIAQYAVNLTEIDTPITIQQKVQELEHRYFARTIEKVLLENSDV